MVMDTNLLVSSLRLFFSSAIFLLFLTAYHFFSPFALAQEIPVLDPAAVYLTCLREATASGIPAGSCRTNLLREAQYSNCIEQTSLLPSPSPAVKNCETNYITSVISDYLNKCLLNYPSEANNCQNYYSPTSNFANCINKTKNPLECEKAFGFKLNPPVRDTVIPPNTFPGVDPTTTTTGELISNALQIVFIFAALAVLIYLVIGAFRWITSGGDKEAIGRARGTIVNALIGLAILALAFFITVLAGQIVGIDLINLPVIPRLGDTPQSFSRP